MPTVATVACGDMVARYEKDEVAGTVRLQVSPGSGGGSTAAWLRPGAG
ncbi:MAG TPA: hypothetical protein VMF65_24340 [Acidimicrobiales bacterium]|nr:hypothetical protein [Acidimicrobiales bacterium]